MSVNLSGNIQWQKIGSDDVANTNISCLNSRSKAIEFRGKKVVVKAGSWIRLEGLSGIVFKNIQEMRFYTSSSVTDLKNINENQLGEKHRKLEFNNEFRKSNVCRFIAPSLVETGNNHLFVLVSNNNEKWVYKDLLVENFVEKCEVPIVQKFTKYFSHAIGKKPINEPLLMVAPKKRKEDKETDDKGSAKKVDNTVVYETTISNGSIQNPENFKIPLSSIAKSSLIFPLVQKIPTPFFETQPSCSPEDPPMTPSELFFSKQCKNPPLEQKPVSQSFQDYPSSSSSESESEN